MGFNLRTSNSETPSFSIIFGNAFSAPTMTTLKSIATRFLKILPIFYFEADSTNSVCFIYKSNKAVKATVFVR